MDNKPPPYPGSYPPGSYPPQQGGYYLPPSQQLYYPQPSMSTSCNLIFYFLIKSNNLFVLNYVRSTKYSCPVSKSSNCCSWRELSKLSYWCIS